jgi:hypothetical protein
VKATYDFHFGHGEELGGAKDSEGAGKERQRASEINQTQQVAAVLKNAKTELRVMREDNNSFPCENGSARCDSGTFTCGLD